MSSKAHRAFGVCSLAALVMGVAMSNPGDVAADPPHISNVRVVNTPLPVAAQGVTQVAGSVGITGTPAVNAQQTGSWTVAVTSLPNVGIDPAQNTVQLSNDASNPLPVRDANNERQPWSFVSSITFAANAQGVFCDTAAYQVPVGKRLVVTQVGIEAGTASGQTVVGLMFHHGTRNLIPTQLVGDSSGFVTLAVTQPLETYLESGQSFWCGAFRTGIGVAATGSMNFSGYLVTTG